MTPSRRIIYPVDFFPLTDPNHQQLVEEFVHKLEGYMGVRRTEVGLAQLWQDKPPHGLFTGGESLQDYMKEVSVFCPSRLVYRGSTDSPVRHRPRSGPCAMIITMPQTNSGPTTEKSSPVSPSLRHLFTFIGTDTPLSSCYTASDEVDITSQGHRRERHKGRVRCLLGSARDFQNMVR